MEDYVVVVGGGIGVAAVDLSVLECFEPGVEAVFGFEGGVGHGLRAPVFEDPDIGVDALAEDILKGHVDIGGSGGAAEDVVGSCVGIDADHVAGSAGNVPGGSVLALGQEGGTVCAVVPDVPGDAVPDAVVSGLGGPEEGVGPFGTVEQQAEEPDPFGAAQRVVLHVVSRLDDGNPQLAGRPVAAVLERGCDDYLPAGSGYPLDAGGYGAAAVGDAPFGHAVKHGPAGHVLRLADSGYAVGGSEGVDYRGMYRGVDDDPVNGGADDRALRYVLRQGRALRYEDVAVQEAGGVPGVGDVGHSVAAAVGDAQVPGVPHPDTLSVRSPAAAGENHGGQQECRRYPYCHFNHIRAFICLQIYPHMSFAQNIIS